jgi:hypothetical protein
MNQHLVEGGGFEPPKAEPSDLQSDPFDRSGTPPKMQARYFVAGWWQVSTEIQQLNAVNADASISHIQYCYLWITDL